MAEDGNFSIGDVRTVLGRYWEPDDVVEIIQAVEKHRTWEDDDSGRVDSEKLMRSWRSAIKACKEQGLGL